jgi:hypothetical protein
LDADAALRAVYRKLASALHPDREPDEAERERKTKLMTLVNTANDRKDLMALLRLQLQIEQIDPLSISALADEKIKQYNRVLKEQLATLTAKKNQIEHQMRAEFGLHYGQVSQKSLQGALRADLADMQGHLQYMDDVYRAIQVDRELKVWIKTQAQLMEEDDGWG